MQTTKVVQPATVRTYVKRWCLPFPAETAWTAANLNTETTKSLRMEPRLMLDNPSVRNNPRG